jgi:enoyl-[acyl-carrier protein] reductase II
VDIPVVAAGSIVDGRGLAAALAFGCQGVWMGTRFIASHEARAALAYKQALVQARDTDTIVTRCYSGKTMRVVDNPYVQDWETRPQDLQPFPQQAIASSKLDVMGGIAGKIEGLDPDRDCMPAGQGTGSIREILSCAQIVERTMSEAEQVLGRLAGIIGR